jgi:hypothetical protein
MWIKAMVWCNTVWCNSKGHYINNSIKQRDFLSIRSQRFIPLCWIGIKSIISCLFRSNFGTDWCTVYVGNVQ